MRSEVESYAHFVSAAHFVFRIDFPSATEKKKLGAIHDFTRRLEQVNAR